MSYYEKPFPSASYDAWKQTEPDYTAYETPECGDIYEREKCSHCEQVKMVCAACHLCFLCEEKMETDEAKSDLGFDYDGND